MSKRVPEEVAIATWFLDVVNASIKAAEALGAADTLRGRAAGLACAWLATKLSCVVDQIMTDLPAAFENSEAVRSWLSRAGWSPEDAERVLERARAAAEADHRARTFTVN